MQYRYKFDFDCPKFKNFKLVRVDFVYFDHNPLVSSDCNCYIVCDKSLKNPATNCQDFKSGKEFSCF